MPKLIGITGLRTSGKDTTCGLMKELLPGQRVDRVAFADKLKIAAARSLGLCEDGEYHDDRDLVALMDTFKDVGVLYYGVKPQGRKWYQSKRPSVAEISGRQYLQYFGANARIVFGDSFWVDQVLPNPDSIPDWAQASRGEELLASAYPLSDVLCVTDVRYPNEARRVRQLGGTIVEIVRPGIAPDGHSSETPLPRELVDTVVHNDGTLDELRASVKFILSPSMEVKVDG